MSSRAALDDLRDALRRDRTDATARAILANAHFARFAACLHGRPPLHAETHQAKS